jgi:hypothetical protein
VVTRRRKEEMNISKNLPIDIELLNKKRMIPVKLAELSYIKPDVTLELLRIWGEQKMPITPFYDKLLSEFDAK